MPSLVPTPWLSLLLQLTALRTFSIVVAMAELVRDDAPLAVRGGQENQSIDADSAARSTNVCRDRLLQPFASSSIWNTPIGSGAELQPAGIFDGRFPLPVDFHIDQEWFVATGADDPVVPWHHGYFQSCAIEGEVMASLRLPENFTTDCGMNNNAAAVLMPNGRHLVEFQPIYRPVPGGPVMGQTPQGCVGQPCELNRCHPAADCDILGNGTTGAHGGSGLSSLGGSIRKGELFGDPSHGAPPIRHALKLEFFGHLYYWWKVNVTTNRTCYRWPAIGCDGYAPTAYRGTQPYVSPGSLLVVPEAAASRIESNLTTTPARRILHALRDYGGYLVDDPDGPAACFCAEKAVIDELKREYGWDLSISNSAGNWTLGVRPTNSGHAFYWDLIQVFRELHVVINNGPDSVGGGGSSRRAPWAPPICPRDGDIDAWYV